MHTRTRTGRGARLRASLLALAVLAGACDSSDEFATTGPGTEVNEVSPVGSPSTPSLGLSYSLTASDVADIEASEAFVRRNGVPYGPYAFWSSYTELKSNTMPFTGSVNYTDARGIVAQIAAARAKGQRLVLAMTGGGHAPYKTDGKFDYTKWKQRMDTFNKSEIKAAVSQGVRDGTIIMNNIMDEPNVKSWGGVMTKARLDEMALYVKRMFPTLPVGVAMIHNWRPYERFRVVDAIITQYSWYMGNIAAFKNDALKHAELNGTSVAFALNILNGGIQNRTTNECPLGITGGRGTLGPDHPACRMTATQVREWSKALGPGSCAMIMWRYDDAFMSRWDNRSAFRDAGSALSGSSARSCRRVS